jgi:hypothetical protein
MDALIDGQGSSIARRDARWGEWSGSAGPEGTGTSPARRSARIIAALALAGAVLGFVWRPHAPRARSASAPATEFSADRAMAHVRNIAIRPHPAGSDDHARVRDYLVGELARLGVQAELQTATSAADLPSPMSARYRVAARVENIIARLPGRHSTAAVLLMAHYDSVAAGPGASDDAAAVAALLETARALRAGPALANDVVLVFSDAEEAGLLGSQALFASPSAAGSIGPIGAAFNFEARGHSGPVLMFETAPGSGWLVRELAASCPDARASSLFDEASRLVPNATDFTFVRARGIPGLNFAYIGGIDHYHNSLDSPERVDPDSVQHHGEYALNLARRLGERDLSRRESTSAVYFNLGPKLIVYSAALSCPLAAIAVMLWLGAVAYGLRIGALRGRAIAGSAGAKLVELIAAVAAATAVTFVAAASHDEFGRLGDTYDHDGYVAGIAALSAAIAIASVMIQRRRSALDVAAGAALPWALLAAATAVWAPGAAFLFTWPLLGSALGLIGGLRRRCAGSGGAPISLGLQASPVVVLVIPMIPVLMDGLTLALAGVAAAITVLALGLLASHVAIVSQRLGLRWPALVAAVGAAFIVHATVRRTPSVERPRQDSVLYAQDTDAGQAVWASSDAALDDWTRPLFVDARAFGPLPNFMPVWDRAFWQARAPVVPLSPPSLDIVSDTTAAGVRTLRILTASTRGARSVIVVVQAGRVLGYRVDGVAPGAPFDEPPPGAPGPWDLWLEAGGARPWELELQLVAGTPVVLRVLDRSDGLPAVEPAIAPRPVGYIPAAGLDIEVWSNASFASRAISLPASRR